MSVVDRDPGELVMTHRPIRTLTTALALAVGVAPLTGTDASMARAASAPVIAMSATFTAHDSGMPTTTVPERRLVSATLTQDLHRGKVLAEVRLEAPPTAATATTLVLVFGFAEGDSCRLAGDHAEFFIPTVGTSGDGVTYDGATITMERTSSYSLIDTWSCAGAALMDGVPPRPPVHDAMSGDLTAVHGEPVLAVSAREPVKAVPGDWVTVHLEVSNTLDSPMEAVGTRLRARGRGLKVRRVPDIGTLAAGETRAVELQVKLKNATARRRTLRLTATSGDVVATSSATVRKVRPAKRPVAGTYRFTKGRGTFRISGRKVTGFTSRVFLTCGGPASPTYEVREVRFPATRIPRSGLVDAVFRRAGSRIDLRMTVRGSRITRGDIQYSRSSPICYGGETFKATRRG